MSLFDKIKKASAIFISQENIYICMKSHNLEISDPHEIISPVDRVLSKFGYLALVPCRGHPVCLLRTLRYQNHTLEVTVENVSSYTFSHLTDGEKG